MGMVVPLVLRVRVSHQLHSRSLRVVRHAWNAVRHLASRSDDWHDRYSLRSYVRNRINIVPSSWHLAGKQIVTEYVADR